MSNNFTTIQLKIISENLRAKAGLIFIDLITNILFLFYYFHEIFSIFLLIFKYNYCILTVYNLPLIYFSKYFISVGYK